MTLENDENEEKFQYFILWKSLHIFTAIFQKNMTAVHDNNEYLEGIRKGDTRVFSDFFEEYYLNLVMFCGGYIRNIHTCEDIVSAVFLHIWETRESFSIERSLKSYLLVAVRNRALNELRHHKVRDEHCSRVLAESILESNDVEHYIFYSDRKRDYEKAVNGLPQNLRETFLMFIEEGLRTQDISERLEITQRAVELRLKKAFSLIRDGLGAVLILINVL